MFEGEVDLVTIPGVNGSFTVLPQHAPLITTIEKGFITYRDNQTEHQLHVANGFVEVKDNIVSVCIETVINE